MDSDFIIVGMGCNIASAPVINRRGAEGGRKATYLFKHLDAACEDGTNTYKEMIEALRVTVAKDIVRSFTQWLYPGFLDSNITKDPEVECERVHSVFTKTIVLNDNKSLNTNPKAESSADIVALANIYLDKSPQNLRLDASVKKNADATPTTTTNSGYIIDQTESLKSAAGRDIVPVCINSDGTLLVRDVVTLSEETLVCDYLF